MASSISPSVAMPFFAVARGCATISPYICRNQYDSLCSSCVLVHGTLARLGFLSTLPSWAHALDVRVRPESVCSPPILALVPNGSGRLGGSRQPCAVGILSEVQGADAVSVDDPAQLLVAERLGRGFEFDPVSLQAKNDPAADRFLSQSMREPWATEFNKG